MLRNPFKSNVERPERVKKTLFKSPSSSKSNYCSEVNTHIVAVTRCSQETGRQFAGQARLSNGHKSWNRGDGQWDYLMEQKGLFRLHSIPFHKGDATPPCHPQKTILVQSANTRFRARFYKWTKGIPVAKDRIVWRTYSIHVSGFKLPIVGAILFDIVPPP